MGRIRTVKPRLFKHTDLFDAEQETGLPLRLSFIGLFTVADREGRFAWNPRELKSDVLPYDEVDFSRVLDALATRGWIRKYTVGGRLFGVIVTFKDHQVVNNREADSFLPSPNEDEGVEPVSTRAARVPDAIPPPLVRATGEREVEGEREMEVEGRSSSLRSDVSAASADPPDLPKFLDRNQVFSEAIEQWNRLAEDLGLPAVRERTEARRRKFIARFSNGSAGKFTEALAAIRGSRFCLGDNNQGWRVSFDFLLQPSSLAKLLEGTYADRNGAPKDSTGIDWDALKARDDAA